VKLYQAVIYLKNIPVFYLPWMSFKINEKGEASKIPTISTYANATDGLVVAVSNSQPINENWNWQYSVKLATIAKSTVGLGLGTSYGSVYNTLNLSSEINGYTTLSDNVSYGTSYGTVGLVGTQTYGGLSERRLGFTINSKRWNHQTLGSWQAGIMGYRVETNNNNGLNLGGSYAGYSINYNLNQYLSLTYQYLQPFGDYKTGTTFGPNITGYPDGDKNNMGSSLAYNLNIPVRNNLRISSDGSYNFHQQTWIARNYRITGENCCYSYSIGWDDVAHTTLLSVGIKF
jgi:hypothetical protein